MCQHRVQLMEGRCVHRLRLREWEGDPDSDSSIWVWAGRPTCCWQAHGRRGTHGPRGKDRPIIQIAHGPGGGRIRGHPVPALPTGSPQALGGPGMGLLEGCEVLLLLLPLLALLLLVLVLLVLLVLRLMG